MAWHSSFGEADHKRARATGLGYAIDDQANALVSTVVGKGMADKASRTVCIGEG